MTIKAVLFALIAINIQGAYSRPSVIIEHLSSLSEEKKYYSHSLYIDSSDKVSDFLDSWLPPLILPLKVAEPPLNADIIATVDKAQDAVAELLDQEQIRLDQAEEIMASVLDAAAENELSAFSEIDIALEDAVAEEIIDTDEKVLILLAAIREGIHADPPETLEETIEAALDAAVAASVIDEDTADAILEVVPDEVEPDPEATISADDVEAAVGDEDDPVAVVDEIRDIAEKAVDAMNEAVDQELITEDEAEDVIELIWEAAKSNDLTILTEVDIALTAAVEAEIIDDVDKVNIIMNAIKENLHNDAPEDLEDAVEAVVDAAVDADIICDGTGDAIKDEAPDAVDPDPDATISDEDVEEAADAA